MSRVCGIITLLHVQFWYFELYRDFSDLRMFKCVVFAFGNIIILHFNFCSNA